MARVITYSTVFPSYHPQAGQPTFFVEKIWESFRRCQNTADDWRRFEVKTLEELLPLTVLSYAKHDFSPKHHTIRAGHRWKVGDKFSPRVWSGVPYQSPQVIIGPDIEVKKIWPIGMRMFNSYKEFYSGDTDLTGGSIARIAMNDGLSSDDLYWWFQKPFEGQIICWNENIEY